MLLDPTPCADSALRNQDLDESQILEHILQTNRIDIPEQSGPLTYRRAEELIRRQREVVDFALPSKPLFEFMAQSIDANQLYLMEHAPGVFDGDIVIFSAARGGNGTDSPHLQSWRLYVAGGIAVYPVDCTHYEMMTTSSLSMYGEQLKLSLDA
jgi:thioesterase domain-containing protein